VELRGSRDRPRYGGTFDDSLDLELHPIVGEVRVSVDANYGDEDEVRHSRLASRLQEALGPFYVYLARLARTRSAVNYCIDAFRGLIESLSRQQVSPDRAGASGSAERPNVASGVAQAVRDPPPERTRPARHEYLRCVHFKTTPGPRHTQ
jgi:hypothetical protein